MLCLFISLSCSLTVVAYIVYQQKRRQQELDKMHTTITKCVDRLFGVTNTNLPALEQELAHLKHQINIIVELMKREKNNQEKGLKHGSENSSGNG
jgi:hypothetical protein